MAALLALILVVPLIYLPGMLLAQVLARRTEAPDLLERLFERVLLGALLNGWLALTLASFGIFSIWLQVGLLAITSGLAWLRLRRFPVLANTLAQHPRRMELLVLGLILLAFGLGVAARPFEVVLGVRDAGVYANTGFAIARTGSLVQHDSLVAQIESDQQSSDQQLAAAAAQAETNLLGVQPRQRTIATRLRQAGFFIHEGDMASGRVVPQGLHLYPAWIGLLTGLAGPEGGLAATGLLGLLGLWSVAMLGRRLAGAWVGLGAAALLATNGAQIWFSRYSTAEVLAQFLTFAGLYAYAAMVDRQATVGAANRPGMSQLPALLCGLAVGQLALARIDFFLVVVPVLVLLFVVWLMRRWRTTHAWLAVGLFAMLLQAAIHIVTIARAYFLDTLFARLQDYALTALLVFPLLTPALQELYLLRPCSRIAIQPCPPIKDMPPTTFTGWNYPRIITELALVLLVILGVLAIRRWGQPVLTRVERTIAHRWHTVLALSAVLIGLLGAYAYLIRPQILNRTTITALPGCLAPNQLRSPQGACLALQGYIGAPVAAPAYIDPLAAVLTQLTQRLRGQPAPSLSACVAARSGLPASTLGLTAVEITGSKIIDQASLGEARWSALQACDRLVLRDLFAISQANLVRVGWYLSPLGVVLAILGLALWWRKLGAASWLFFVVTLASALLFLRLTYGTSDQHYIYILRRYVPQVYPAFCLGIAYALWWLARPGTPAWWKHARRGLALAGGLGLLLFNLATNQKILVHTEYSGALAQLRTIAARFEPDAIMLLRGGGPRFASARDLPDNLATPLTYAFGRQAFTIKSAEPGKYANELAHYVAYWQAQGHPVYLLSSASGAVGLPGYGYEALGPISLNLAEFEQPTSQKPTNIQQFIVDFQVYRLRPASTALPGPISASDYATQVAGFYRTEQIDGTTMAWTDGDALLRLPRPDSPGTITLHLAPGPSRPARLGVPRVCISYRAEVSLWVEDPYAPAFSQPVCLPMQTGMASYPLPYHPPSQASTTLLLRIQSDTWLPARDDPAQHDQRLLGVLFGELHYRSSR